MKTNPQKTQLIQRYCHISGAHVILVTRTHDSAVSLIALAAACAMHAINYICASIAVTAEMEAALGAGQVIRLSKLAFEPDAKALRRLLQRARDEQAILLIDITYDQSIAYHNLDELLDLKRNETLTSILSLANQGSARQGLYSCWSCKPDQSMMHIIGDENSDSYEIEEYNLTHMTPIWHSGPITKQMLDVLNRRDRYRDLPPMPEMLCKFGPIPYCSLILHDPYVDDVIQMLGCANHQTWKHVISSIADEIA